MCFAFINFEAKWELMYVIPIHICENIIKQVERHGKYGFTYRNTTLWLLFYTFFFDIMRILGILHFEIFNLTSLIHISLMEQPDEYSFLNIH